MASMAALGAGRLAVVELMVAQAKPMYITDDSDKRVNRLRDQLT